MAPASPDTTERKSVYRHALVVRVTHWINVLGFSLLLMSGMQIFNAHPRLYWGQYGANADSPFITLDAVDNGRGGMRGVARVGRLEISTTGVLGVSKEGGEWRARGFPAWLTLPSYQDLATGRRWHFLAAWLLVINGLVYLIAGAATGHFRRDFGLARGELTGASLAREIWDHIRFRNPGGAGGYNTLQKISYILVVFVLLPAMVLSGLTMSPAIDAAAPGLLDLFGGRQSARTIHFLTAASLVLFVVVHVIEVFVAGVWNEMRSMITGWYRLEKSDHDAA
jgi:thiosulfate reductase cytochrome b subunit